MSTAVSVLQVTYAVPLGVRCWKISGRVLIAVWVSLSPRMCSRVRLGLNLPVSLFFFDLLEVLYSTPYGGSVMQRAACSLPSSFFQLSGFLASPHSKRCGPSFHSLPGRVSGFFGIGGRVSLVWLVGL
jgi:hypothetical protein